MSSTGLFIYASYPRTSDLEFNMEYYLNNHMALIDKHWRQFGLKSWSVIQFPEGDTSGLQVQTILHFDSKESWDKVWKAEIPEITGDLKNYSNVPPTLWTGQVLKQG